jgi:hypothetical protein
MSRQDAKIAKSQANQNFSIKMNGGILCVSDRFVTEFRLLSGVEIS